MMQTLFSGHIIFSLHIIQLQTFFAPPLSEYKAKFLTNSES